MAVFKCKMCGGNLNIEKGVTVYECEYCGTKQTVPCADDEKKMLLFSRANRLRFDCDFDRAAGIYESIISDFPEEAEAYWGLVLCKYGIEYIDDPLTAKKIPTCHRSSFNSIFDDENFKLAIKNADDKARDLYNKEAQQIEELRKDIIEVSSKEEPYDIFICYKETDASGERTVDSVIAQDVYTELTKSGYRVFFSRITLENKLGQEYEPYIFAALNSAKVMLVFGTDYEHFNAVWVKNEWLRFLQLIAVGEKKTLIPCYKDIDAYDLPKEFARLQAQDMGKVGGMQDLLRGVKKLIDPSYTSEKHDISQNNNIAELLKMGNAALESGNWKVARNRFDVALVADPKCADAYIGKFMIEHKINKRSDIPKCKKTLQKNAYFQDALTFASDSLKQELEEYCAQVDARRKKKTKCKRIIVIFAVISLIVLSFIVSEIVYNNTIRSVYAGTISVNDAYKTLSWIWYKKPDDGTKNIICQDTNQSLYPEAKLIQRVNVPKGVTVIGDWAFHDCDNLTNITIPKGVMSIGERAFSGCDNLTDITIAEGVTSIGDNAFRDCDNLTDIAIPNSVTSIGDYAFYACRSLTDITIPEGVISIGSNVFGSVKTPLIIYCEAKEKPVGWSENWIRADSDIKVHWGYKK